ncbi:MAG: tRNA uridine-5-carboxymethylaminomethyl(34) synthesis GTPase MnmE [Rhodospirillaceae bacterium]|nr:tRNA uridine-5-carboxymethylaminomethyl(34) synthesis GTPase MnmE [Rhodospirillaceae bacterium]
MNSDSNQILDQTIFALASGLGKSGIAVFRLSGPSASDALRALSQKQLPEPRRATRVQLKHPKTDDLLDDGLAIYFPGPASFTGEDVVELHVHGGRAVIAGITEALAGLKDVRLAEAGEFTRRAFDHGKFDLTAAEGLADLINAETAAQRRQAHRQLHGDLGLIYDDWRDRLLKAIALFEAEIDFSDEDLPPGLHAEVAQQIAEITEEISEHLDDKGQGQILREGLYITIIGPPNAGKSSLLNRLSRRDVAIVSEHVGTTRDVIEVHLELDGYPVILADTAGLREAADDIESEGVRRAQERAHQADLKLAVFDGATWPEKDSQTLDLIDEDTVIVLNKADLLDKADTEYLAISVETGDGLDVLLEKLKNEVAERCHLSASPALTRTRHRTALDDCLGNLQRFPTSPETELKAEDLRLAARALGRITGRVDVEEVLDIIFKEFCIGK